MKNKFVVILRYQVLGVFVGAICCAGSAMAQAYGAKAQPATSASPGATTKSTPLPADYSTIPRKDDSSSKSKSTSTSGGLSTADKTFIMNAAKGGTMEVEWGKVAAANSQNADVKKFGNRMVTDHSKANDELKAIAAKKGVGLPSEKVKTIWKSDKQYMDMMVKDHEKDLAEFQREARSGSDADVKKFADKTSKVVQKHLAMAKEIDAKVK